MPIDIQFIETVENQRLLIQKRFQLRDENGVWIGPEVNIVPIQGLPLISRWEMRVTGKPDVVAARLQSTYTSRRLDKPVPLPGPRALVSGRVPNTNPLSSESVCELHVTVWYYDATSDGKPIGVEKSHTATCLLFTGPPPQTPPELVVRLRELVILAGQTGSQVVTVRNPTGEAPKLALVYPGTIVSTDDPDAGKIAAVVPELRSQLEAVLTRAPSIDATNPLVHEFRWTFDIRLSDQIKAVLAGLDQCLHIHIDTTLKGAKSVRWLLKLEAQVKAFPGWVVIDFGTTNSTVTLHDIWDYEPFVGLPKEQEEYLQNQIVEWMGMGALEALGRNGKQLEVEWNNWRKTVAVNCGAVSWDGLKDWLRSDFNVRFYTLLAQMELALKLHSEAFRRTDYNQLCRWYRDALRIPPLRSLQLFPLRIDPDTQSYSIASEIEIQDVEIRKRDPEDRWPRIAMGRLAQRSRLEAISRGDEVPLEIILQRFHPSPKRYFGTEHGGFDVVVNNNRIEHVSVNQLMRAGWEKLLFFADQARKDDRRYNEGPIRRAVITYPTVSPPSVRQDIQTLIKNLGIADVRTDYDEAIASAIFYIMREYNTATELGLETFKARCRVRSEDGWTQYVLVLVIGGGTTDVALIRLTLTEEPVFPAGADRGAGGRYYKITPQLLSSSGHMQLGGELMTLRIFRLLKAMIVDKLLTLTQEGRLSCDTIRKVLDSGLPEEAVQAGKYRSGWLQDVIESENPDNVSPRLREALNLAERVLPTRWSEGEGRRSKFEVFYTLWEYAEEAKKSLGSKMPGWEPRAARDPYVLTAKKVEQLLDQANLSHSVKDSKSLEVRLTVDQMERAIRKVVQEAVKIAEGALQRLPQGHILDWLILSGQSCNLNIVDEELRKTFASERFVWNPERVTFLPEYAKLSTSIGACYAENLRRSRFAPADSVKSLKRGVNILYFDINNLFSYLPCSFNIFLPGIRERIFAAGQELFELEGVDDPERQRGCCRSNWGGPQSISHSSDKIMKVGWKGLGAAFRHKKLPMN